MACGPRRPKFWGQLPSSALTSLCFQNVGGSFKWLRYPAAFNLDEKTEYCILLRNFDEHFEPVIKCMKGIL